jgi:hypothetical protein
MRETAGGLQGRGKEFRAGPGVGPAPIAVERKCRDGPRSSTVRRAGRSGKPGSAPIRHRGPEWPACGTRAKRAYLAVRSFTPGVASRSPRSRSRAPHGGSCVFRLGSRSGPCRIAPAAISKTGANKAISKRILNDICPPYPKPQKAEAPTSVPYHKGAWRCVRYVTCRVGNPGVGPSPLA